SARRYAMTCERFWRGGVVLFERGEEDPHRDDCVDCQQAHAACLDMIGGMPMGGDDVGGGPLWKAEGRGAMDAREAKSRWWRWSWWLNGAFAGAAAIVLVWLLVGRKPEPDEVIYGISTTSGTVTRRSGHVSDDQLRIGMPMSRNVEDSVKVTVHPDEE